MNALLQKGITKKALAQTMRERRVMTPFNTGSRVMKSKKDYSRAEGKRVCREQYDR